MALVNKNSRITKKGNIGIHYLCPACRIDVEESRDTYRCLGCSREYPILFGLADFRLRSDRYLSLEQERAKAKRLYEYAKTASFVELLEYYYTITDDVPTELAIRYSAAIHNGPVQAGTIMADLGSDLQQHMLLDAGCGPGGFLVGAGGSYQRMVGVDIALRWLVVCRKRLEEQGIDATLVCADIEALPFPDGMFDHVVGVDVLEHVRCVDSALSGLDRVLADGGKVWLSASNRYCVGPHPTTRIWAVGYLPRRLRTRVIRAIRGVDSMRFTNLISPRQLLKRCLRTGFELIRIGPRTIAKAPGHCYPLQDRILIALYCGVHRLPMLHGLLLWIGPSFEMVMEKRKMPRRRFL